MDAITFCFLISLAISEGLDIRFMDVITTNLYWPMDNDIYMKIPEGLKLSKTNSTKPCSIYSEKLDIALNTTWIITKSPMANGWMGDFKILNKYI